MCISDETFELLKKELNGAVLFTSWVYNRRTQCSGIYSGDQAVEMMAEPNSLIQFHYFNSEIEAEEARSTILQKSEESWQDLIDKY